MRHGNTNRKFGRTSNQRKELMRNLAIALLERGKIETSEAKAKDLRPYVERIITKGKNDTVASRRLVSAKLNRAATDKLFKEIGPKFKDRAGGYTRIRHLANRMSDGARMAIIELVS